MTKLVKTSMTKFFSKVLDQEFFMAMLKSINRLLTTCLNFDLLYLLYIPLDIIWIRF